MSEHRKRGWQKSGCIGHNSNHIEHLITFFHYIPIIQVSYFGNLRPIMHKICFPNCVLGRDRPMVTFHNLVCTVIVLLVFASVAIINGSIGIDVI